jgi:hypothetical protein
VGSYRHRRAGATLQRAQAGGTTGQGRRNNAASDSIIPGTVHGVEDRSPCAASVARSNHGTMRYVPSTSVDAHAGPAVVPGSAPHIDGSRQRGAGLNDDGRAQAHEQAGDEHGTQLPFTRFSSVVLSPPWQFTMYMRWADAFVKLIPIRVLTPFPLPFPSVAAANVLRVPSRSRSRPD